MHHPQRGMTFLGFIILVAFLLVFVFAGIRLVPVFVEYMNVAKAIDSLKGPDAGSLSSNAIRVAIEKRFNVDDVHSIEAKDLEIKRDGEGWLVRAAYDAEAPFIANVSFLVHFDKSSHLGPAGGSGGA